MSDNIKEYLVSVTTTNDRYPTATKIMLGDNEIWNNMDFVQSVTNARSDNESDVTYDDIYPPVDAKTYTNNPSNNDIVDVKEYTGSPLHKGAGAKKITTKSTVGKNKKIRTTMKNKKKTRTLRKKNKL